MKKFYKNALITAGILFAAGAVILVICTFVGGSSFHNDVKSGNISELVSLFHFNNSDTSHSAFHVDNRTVHFDFNDEYPVYSGSRTDNEAADASKIKHINIDLGGGEYIIEQSSDNHYFQIVAESSDTYQYYTENSTFYVIGFDGSSINCGDRHNKLTLRLPSDLEFTDVTISLGAGNLEWDSLTTDSLILDAGAGSITLSNGSAATKDVNLGAGIIDLNHCTLQNASFEVGMGELNYSGVIRGDLTADCGMGSLTFAFIDSEQKHNYSLDGSMGSISIGDKGYGGLEYEKTLNNNASSNYELSCSMGNITVTFED